MSVPPPSSPSAESSLSHPTIRRAVEDRLLVGVCGGLARAFAVPPLAVRLGAIALAIPAAPFVLTTYAVLAVVVPREDGRTLLGGTPNDPRENVIGWGIVALAAIVLLAAGLDGTSGPGLDPVTVFFAICAGLGVAAMSTRRAAALPGSRAPTGAPTWSAATASPPERPVPLGDEPAPRPVPLGDEPDPPRFVAPDQRATVRIPLGPQTPGPPRAHSSRLPGPSLLLVGFAAIVLVTGCVATLEALGLHISAGGAAAVLGAGAVAAAAGAIAFHRRRHAPGLLVLGVALAGAAAGVAAVRTELDQGIGSRHFRPLTVSQLQHEYQLGIGELVIDLRDTDLPPGTTTVRADVGIGVVTVRVPDGVRVEDAGPTPVDGAGEINRRVDRSKPSARERRQQRTVRINADAGLGAAEVWTGDRDRWRRFDD